MTDSVAQFFAATFYGLAQKPGVTLGAALREARREARKKFPDDPTYLTYSLYAHPNAKLWLNGNETSK